MKELNCILHKRLCSFPKPLIAKLKVKCELWESPKTIHDTAIALGNPPELDGKILLLKTPHTFIGETKVVLTRKLPCRRLASIVLKGAKQASGVKKSSSEPYELE